MQHLTSPAGSRARLPKQIQRALPVYIVLIFVLILFANFDSFISGGKAAKNKRDVPRRSHKLLHAVPPKGARFPRKIWQTWKVGAMDFEERDLTTARTWTVKNPGHRYEVLTDNNDMAYVETHFGLEGVNRPDIVEMYSAVTAKIIKADILRYLIMYVEGGVYADIDVEDLKPVDRWIPDRYDEADVDAVISVEIDEPEFKDHPILGKKSMSFCQWTFLSKPGLPVFLKLVENIIDWLNDLSEKQSVPISDLKLDFDEVISGTGPSAFTNAVLEAMSDNTGKQVTWDTFHNMAESKLVGGFLVLTVEAFAAGQGHSDSGNHNARTALVKHHYHASMWPTNHPRYSHPIYGEVERCNWDLDCIRLWDANKASFDALSPEERAVRLALAEADVQRLALMPKEAPVVFPQQPIFPDQPLFPDQQKPMFPPADLQPISPPTDPQPASPPIVAPLPMFPPAADAEPPQLMVFASNTQLEADAQPQAAPMFPPVADAQQQPQPDANGQPLLGVDGLS
ncbi:Initiation-specific alpha-1 [Hyphodiscus hymeniophilus]|uniref:Initiation-specific alpha-1 n=1 Tax=Hyphodiscus hymeniophilus TaxID=353542 RepID=A0A9P7AUG6_9HELO|nr:Initiation-specific alpha-1 [Hyphodiscus hymeniophilus]